MSGDLYRDAHVGLRARLADLWARILEREALVTEEFWSTVSEEERERLDALRDAEGLVQADIFEELARAEGMLAGYLAALDALVATLPALEADWATVPDDVEPPPRRRVTLAMRAVPAPAAHGIAREFEAMVRERDRRAEVGHDGRVTSWARFRDQGCPLALRATILSSANGEIGEVAMSLVTTIPRALPALVVRHETLVLTVGKALGIKHEVEVGEPSFDGLFLIEGTQDAANLFLTTAVRGHLLTLARFDVPTLTVTPKARCARLDWRFEPAARALEAAVRVLLAVHETSPYLRLRRD